MADLSSPIPRYPVRLVASRTGLSAHVLRAWERRYRVVSPTRSEGGQRLYSDLDVERLLRLRRLVDRGHSIGRIAALELSDLVELEKAMPDLSPTPAPEEGDGARTASESAAHVVSDALRAIRRLDAGELQALLERSAITMGVPVLLDRVLTPLLERVGHGWSEGWVSVAQEHLASAVIRRVLGWVLRLYEPSGAAPHMVVATPPHYAHELGGLMVAASAAAEGWRVTYLGPDLPAAELVAAAEQTGARVVAISAVHQPHQGDLLGLVRDARARLPREVTLVVGGAAALERRGEIQALGGRVMESLAEFRALLPRLTVPDELVGERQ
jgi:DNA-binding transcriptional MerR regulator/methylmalonyl-CoA mutase cobalamin-binding subunit